jgi:acyl-CoA dehydrogenase
MVDFERSDTEQMIRSAVQDIMDDYDETYFEKVREQKRFPDELWNDLAANGMVGVAIPEEYGGEGLGIYEMVAVMEEVGFGGGWSITQFFYLTPVFGGETLIEYGSEAQKSEWLPRISDGDARWALGVTEPDAGLNTPEISTFAEKDGDEYVVNGRKIWTSDVAEADSITLLVRTLPKEERDSKTHGLSILLVDPNDPNVEYEAIQKELWTAPVSTYNVYFDDVRVHESQLVGEEHQGLYHIFDTLNSERVTVGISLLMAGYYALEQASDYANDRMVFDDPIGTYQAIQHPLADAYADLECARLMCEKAAWMYDNEFDAREVGTASNIAKLKAAEAAWDACEAAMTTFGGMSVAKDIHVNKAWQRVRHARIAPVSEQMIRNYLAEHELGLPRSY